MIDNNIQQQFIQETLDFFAQNNLECEFRDNKDGVCTFITPETKSILFYDEVLDLGINIGFEKRIDIKIENSDSHYYKVEYNLNIFRCKLEMILEYIQLHRKMILLEEELRNPKLNTKWKAKLLLKKFDSEQIISNGE